MGFGTAGMLSALPAAGDGMLTWAYVFGGVALAALVFLIIAFIKRRKR